MEVYNDENATKKVDHERDYFRDVFALPAAAGFGPVVYAARMARRQDANYTEIPTSEFRSKLLLSKESVPIFRDL